MTAPFVFVVVAAAIGAASLFARDAMVRALAYCALLVGVVMIWFGSLGQARPTHVLPWLTPPAGTVVAYRLDEPRAIYVWLSVQGHAGPLSLRLPWSERQAADLADAARAAKKGGEQVKMGGHDRARHGDGRGGLRGKEKPMFYPAPPPALPAKTAR